MYKSLNDVRSAFPYFFNERAMHGFDSRIESELYTSASGRQFFLTSERQIHGTRKWTVRKVEKDNITNYTQFCTLTQQQASRALAKALKG